MNNFKRNLAVWLKDNVDFALFLAVLTETPRWAVAFMAVNEPLWVGIPLGVLLAFATSHAWRAYFETRHWGLFTFNVISIVIAVAVIAPVLFAMTSKGTHDINIASVLNNTTKAVWCTLLALTTFIPLVQLAAVQGLKHPPEQPQRQPRAIKTVRQTEHTEQLTLYAEQFPEQPVVIEAEQANDLTAASDEQKRRYLAELLVSGKRLNKTQLAKQFAIGRTTLYAWIEELSPEPAQ